MLIAFVSKTTLPAAFALAASTLRFELARFQLPHDPASDSQAILAALTQASQPDIYRYAVSEGRKGCAFINEHLREAALLRYRDAIAEELCREYAFLNLSPENFQSVAADTIVKMSKVQRLHWPSAAEVAAILAAEDSVRRGPPCKIAEELPC